MRPSFRAKCVLAIVLPLISTQVAFSAQKKFPEGVSPSSVFAKVDRVNRSIDVILNAAEVKTPNLPDVLETKLGPMHVYQMNVACIREFHEFERKANLRPMPIVVSRPMKYAPSDVGRLVDMLQREVEYVAKRLKIKGVPTDLKKFSGKTSTHVFQETVNVFFKVSVLRGQKKITPNTVYAELVTAVGDARSILSQIDPACRYNIAVPPSKTGLKPSDVFENCLAARH